MTTRIKLQDIENLTLSGADLTALQSLLGISGSSQAFPVGSIFVSAVSTNPATLLGYGTWSQVAQGQVIAGFKSGDADFGTLGGTGGAKTVASAGSNSAPTFTGSAMTGVGYTPAGTVAAPVFTGNALAAHTHQVTAAGTNASVTVATTSGSKAGTSAGAFTAIGGVSPGSSFTVGAQTFTGSAVTSGNPSATLTPSGTNSAPAFTGTPATINPGTPAGTVSAPTFTGSATSVLQPFLTVMIWQRTA